MPADAGYAELELEVLMRPGCHLCEQALATIAAVGTELRVDLRVSELDIESDQRLLARYLERIPVVRLAGEEIAELLVGREELLAGIERLRPELGRGAEPA